MVLEDKSDGRLKSGTMNGEADPTPPPVYTDNIFWRIC